MGKELMDTVNSLPPGDPSVIAEIGRVAAVPQREYYYIRARL